MYATTLRKRIVVGLIAALLAVSGAFATSAVTASEAEAQPAPGRGGPLNVGGDQIAIAAPANATVAGDNLPVFIILLSR